MTYTYQRYPMWVTPPGGVPCVVHSAEQEAAVMELAIPPVTVPNPFVPFTVVPRSTPFAFVPPAEPPKPLPSEKDTLRHEATALGITVDGRWSVDRLKAEINQVNKKDRYHD